MNEHTSRLNQSLTERKTQLALESVLQLRNSPDYMVIIDSIDLIKKQYGRLFSDEEIEGVYNAFLTTGHPFRFCHLLLMPYYISFNNNPELKGHISEPNEWPPILPIETILCAIELTCPNSQKKKIH